MPLAAAELSHPCLQKARGAKAHLHPTYSRQALPKKVNLTVALLFDLPPMQPFPTVHMDGVSAGVLCQVNKEAGDLLRSPWMHQLMALTLLQQSSMASPLSACCYTQGPCSQDQAKLTDGTLTPPMCRSMDKAISHLQEILTGVRVGRASAGTRLMQPIQELRIRLSCDICVKHGKANMVLQKQVTGWKGLMKVVRAPAISLRKRMAVAVRTHTVKPTVRFIIGGMITLPTLQS